MPNYVYVARVSVGGHQESITGTAGNAPNEYAAARSVLRVFVAMQGLSLSVDDAEMICFSAFETQEGVWPHV
jgi:hypothetical protein